MQDIDWKRESYSLPVAPCECWNRWYSHWATMSKHFLFLSSMNLTSCGMSLRGITLQTVLKQIFVLHRFETLQGFCCKQSTVASISPCFAQSCVDCTDHYFSLLLCLPSGIFSRASYYFITHSAACWGQRWFERSVLQVSLLLHWSAGFSPQRDEVTVVILPKRSLITRPWTAPYLSVCCFSTGLIVFDSAFQSDLLTPVLGGIEKSVFILLLECYLVINFPQLLFIICGCAWWWDQWPLVLRGCRRGQGEDKPRAETLPWSTWVKKGTSGWAGPAVGGCRWGCWWRLGTRCSQSPDSASDKYPHWSWVNPMECCAACSIHSLLSCPRTVQKTEWFDLKLLQQK